MPLSVARAVLCNDPVLQPQGGPKVDVVATAKVDLKADQAIDAIGGYLTYGQAENYAMSLRERLLPMGLAEGCILRRDVPRDTVLTYDDVDVPPGRVCDRLRGEQTRHFGESSVRR
jgi:predicted homoserine dehydrogenase-like protein